MEAHKRQRCLEVPVMTAILSFIVAFGVTAIAGVYSYVIWKKLTPAE